MFRLIACVVLITLSNLAMALSCVPLSLAIYASKETNLLVAFKIIDENAEARTWNAEITRTLNGPPITSKNIRIRQTAPYGLGFTLDFGGEYILPLQDASDGTYQILLCARPVAFKDNVVLGLTGIAWLDKQAKGTVTFDKLEIALQAYRQGLSETDFVCRSTGLDYCNKSRATYDTKTGVLNLPLIQYPDILGYFQYTNAQLQKTNDNPLTFIVTRIQ